MEESFNTTEQMRILIAEIIQLYIESISLINENINDFKSSETITDISDKAFSFFAGWWRSLSNLSHTLKTAKQAIEVLQKIKDNIEKKTESQNISEIEKKLLQNFLYLDRKSQELTKFLEHPEQYNIQELQKIWNYSAVLNQVFFQAYYRLQATTRIAQAQKQLEINNCKAEQITKECENAKTNLHKLINDSKEKQESIDRLMANATKLGLAQRYTEEKDNNNLLKWLWTILAIFGLFWIFQLSDISFLKLLGYSQATQGQTSISLQSQSFSDYALNFLKKSPAYLALIWFILFASRRRNEADRLASDYAHKEVFASSYEAYLKEIQKLKEMGVMSAEKQKESEELATKLLDSMIGVLSDNPAKSLDTKKTTDELPAKELVNLASEIIKFKGKNT